jgi:hypothetical protein
MLSKTYTLLFNETLQNFANKIIATENDESKRKQFSLFYPSLGKNYLENRELLVVGQAANGWFPKWYVQEVEGNDGKIVTESIGYSTDEEGKCPLEWVNERWKEYNLSRSFFWNVTYKLVKSHYGKTDENWNNIIAWSNLMKIAPADRGNPNSEEIEAQVDGAARLFRQEIIDLDPKNVLVVTNLKTWAKPILEKAEIQFQRVDGQYAEAIGCYNKSKIIVTRRPFLGGKHQPFIDEISKLLTTR